MSISFEALADRLSIADALFAGRSRVLNPQDLPGRYGRVVKAIDRVLAACGCQAVVGGGWAVWRHGYIGRVTQDIDIVLPADRVEDFLQAAAVSGFRVLTPPQGRWPKMTHDETGIEVDILPEGGRPGTPSKPAPTTIPHPDQLGAVAGTLRYIALAPLIELKLAAGRLRDLADVAELLRENPSEVDTIRDHLAGIAAAYAEQFDELLQQAREEDSLDA